MFISLLIFLSSTLWGNLGLLVLVSILQLRYTSIKTYDTILFKIIIVISILSLFNYLISLIINGGRFENNSNTPYPYAFSMIISYIIAYTLSYNNIKWLLLFFTIDCIVGVAEYSCGVKSFWETPQDTFEASSELLYFKRSAGLSESSSSLGLKACLGLCLVYIVRPKYKIIYICILIAGLFCSFNRSYIIASLPILLYFCYSDYKRCNTVVKFIFIFSGICGFIIILVPMIPLIEEQFLRGGTSLSGGALSHRDQIWFEFMNYFYDHPIIGNGSVKMLLANGWHAHNSFIWVLASNGLIIAILYYIYLVAFINKKIFFPMLTIILGSITQCSIFWGLSISDILVFYLILHRFQVPVSKEDNISFEIKDQQVRRSKIPKGQILFLQNEISLPVVFQLRIRNKKR